MEAAAKQLVSGNVVDAGDVVVATGKERRRVRCALVIQFDSHEDIQRAIEERRIEFTMFGR